MYVFAPTFAHAGGLVMLSVAQTMWYWMIGWLRNNGLGCVRKWSWPHLKFYSGMCLEILGEIMNNFSLGRCFHGSLWLIKKKCLSAVVKVLGTFTKLWEVTVSFIIPVCACICSSVRMEQLGSRWMDFHEIWCLGDFLKICVENSVFIKILQ